MARSTSQRSARDELRRIFERALAAEPSLGAEATTRAVRRLMRRTGRIAELGAELKVGSNAASRKRRAAPPEAQTGLIHQAPPAPPRQEFDPYAFGAVVTLARFGRGALLERLAAIDSAEHLRRLAAAQHICIEAAISDIGELRAAIVSGAEQRLADRHAAAS